MTATRGSESERRTRKARIDPKLKAWGWQIVPFDPAKSLSKYTRHAIEEYPTANGPADYALVVDGQMVSVVEAKKVTLGELRNGVSPRPIRSLPVRRSCESVRRDKAWSI